MKMPDEIKNGLNHCSENGCKQCPYDYDCDMADGFSVLAYDDVSAYIQHLENHIEELNEKMAQFEANQPKWISVEERLPEKNGKYIVCTAKGSVYCTKFSIDVCGIFHTDMYTHITHWMPLPEPPKEGK